MNIFKKGSKFYSISKNKCPRCHEGSFWPNSPLKNLIFNKGSLNNNCSYCGLKFEIELGFWYGAMYISYALGVLLMLIIWLLHFLIFPNVDIKDLIIFIMLSIILFCPYNFFFSRLIWINLFVSFSPSKKTFRKLN